MSCSKPLRMAFIQDRVTGTEVDVAVVTNVTHEHLDYHGSYDAYLKAKGILLGNAVENR